MTQLSINQLCDRVLSNATRQGANSSIALGQLVEEVGAANAPLLAGGVEEHFLFLKPELLSVKHKDPLQHALKLVFSPLMAIGEIDQVVLIAADSQAARTMVRGQYRILRALANEPSAQAEHAVHDCLQSEHPLPVYTASQALEMFWRNDTAQLSEDWDKGTCIKVGPGLYASRMSKGGHAFAVLNGFYPYQESWLCQHGGQLLCFRLKTTLPLSKVREEVVGSVNPECARPGSIRHQLYLARETLGFNDIAISRNALHIAPNALDSCLGMRFLSRLGNTAEAGGLFHRYVELHQPSLLQMLSRYISPADKLSAEQLMLHTRCEDLTYRECLDVMSDYWPDSLSAIQG